MRISKAGICPEGLKISGVRRGGENALAAGFTLLELLVVIFIVSLLLAVTFPSFTFQTDESLKSEAGRVASILRYLNDDTISTKEASALKIIFAEKTLHYKGPDGEKKETIKIGRAHV